MNLTCCVLLEYFNANGSVSKRRRFPRAVVTHVPLRMRIEIVPVDGVAGASTYFLPLAHSRTASSPTTHAAGRWTLECSTPRITLFVSDAPTSALTLLLSCIGSARQARDDEIALLRSVLHRRGSCEADTLTGGGADGRGRGDGVLRRGERMPANGFDEDDLLARSAAARARAVGSSGGASSEPDAAASGGSIGDANTNGAPALTVEQARVVTLASAGTSLFFTGSAGTGKSLVLGALARCLPGAAFTASTGIAAVAVGGTTVHMWSGVSPAAVDAVANAPTPTARAIALREAGAGVARRGDAVVRWRGARALIVDEVSMLSGDFIDALDFAGRAARGVARPFGGLQVIFTGDFAQLPPVTRGGVKPKFAFEADAWVTAIRTIVRLTRVFRQGADAAFAQILEEARWGRLSAQSVSALRSRVRAPLKLPPGVIATQLGTHRAAVDADNARELAALPGRAAVFVALDASVTPSAAALLDGCTAPARLELKVGAQVVLTKTVDAKAGLVNGARGVVVALPVGAGPGASYPVVRFLAVGGAVNELVVRPVLYEFRSGNNTIATRRQVPLALAWALSIHKSQGMTLDAAALSLKDVFECGQAYVALSRLRALMGVTLTGDFDAAHVRAHPKVVEFYEKLEADEKQRAASLAAEGRGKKKGDAATNASVGVGKSVLACAWGVVPPAGLRGASAVQSCASSRVTTANASRASSTERGSVTQENRAAPSANDLLLRLGMKQSAAAIAPPKAPLSSVSAVAALPMPALPPPPPSPLLTSQRTVVDIPDSCELPPLRVESEVPLLPAPRPAPPKQLTLASFFGGAPTRRARLAAFVGGSPPREERWKGDIVGAVGASAAASPPPVRSPPSKGARVGRTPPQKAHPLEGHGGL